MFRNFHAIIHVAVMVASSALFHLGLLLALATGPTGSEAVAEDEAAGADDGPSAAPELLSSPHPLRLNFGRNTLSPVREHHDGLGGGGGSDGDLVALMRQRVIITKIYLGSHHPPDLAKESSEH